MTNKLFRIHFELCNATAIYQQLYIMQQRENYLQKRIRDQCLEDF